ncbi:MAG: BolA family protein [Xenophilus sp.]
MSGPTLPTAAELDAALRAALAPAQLEVIDESGAHAGHAGARAEGYGTHFRVRIASPRFAGLPRVARHRLVYDAVQVFVPRGLHALAIETLQLPSA